MAGDNRREGISESAGRVLAVLEARGPELAIVVLARLSGMAPSTLAPLLDELYDAGYVDPGTERRSVRALPIGADGRFRRPRPAPREPAWTREPDG